MPEEMTNQSIESNDATDSLLTSSTDDDWGLFDDEGVDQPEETSEGETIQEEQNAQEELPFLTIKYNGADEKLTQEQAIALAQKGRNYDKIFGELQNLRNSQEMKALNDLAAAAGLSLSDYVRNLQNFQESGMIQQIARGLKEKYPESSDELINEMAKSQYEKMNADKQRQRVSLQQTQEQQRKDALNRQVDALLKEYPDVDITKLPDDVIAVAAQGETLLGAYHAYELKNLREKYAALETEKNALIKNLENRRKSTGSMKGKGGPETTDPFLEGFRF